ncbi:MlaD family protein [Halomonas sp. 86]|uniref:MlaD family protein n=1 Tax=unclassified Halomonas TaxID=2609666 RepID=UPI00403347A1
METRAHHVLIGLFTVITAAAALLFTLWISHAAGQRDYQTYRVLFERSVSGLTVGSAVQYNGIRVGDVTTLNLNPADPRQVIAKIRVEKDTPVKEDTHAQLAFASITGSMSIQLYGGTPDSPALIDHAGDEIPVIHADPSPLSTFLEEGKEVVDNINSILANVNNLFDDSNRQNASNVLTNIDQITEMIASQREAFEENLALLGSASRQATTTMASINVLSEQVTQLLEQDGQNVMQNAANASQDIARAAQRMEQLIEQNADAVDSTLQGTRDIGPALSSLRSTLNSLDRIARELDENPIEFLLGRDQIKEFSP